MVPALLYITKVPTLSCRLGCDPYDHAFAVLTCGLILYDQTFDALINMLLIRVSTNQKVTLAELKSVTSAP